MHVLIALDLYEIQLQANGRSPHTMRQYRRHLRLFADWLAANGHTDVHLIGRGWGALPATFAALFSPHVKQVTLKNSLPSYAHVAESEEYDVPLSSLLPDVLAHFDLPDCYRELSKKHLRQVAMNEGN